MESVAQSNYPSLTAPGSKLTLAVSSTVLFVGAFHLTTLLHELGHFVAYLAFHTHPTLYFNRVEAAESTVSRSGLIVSALAGPFTSLAQGFLCAWWVRTRRANTNGYLFVQWLALLGFINFFGYLMLTAFSSVGDTGKVAALLGVPTWLDELVSAVGIALLIVAMIRQDRHFEDFLDGEPGTRDRARWINALVYFPILAGSVVNVAFAFPISTAIGALDAATSSLSVLAGYWTMLRLPRTTQPRMAAGELVSCAWVVATLALLAINRLLVRGIG